jgi:hypothetical protein
MKWTQKKVEEKLLTKLKELGTGHNQIAESLTALKIKGTPGDADDCPMARLAQKLFKSADAVSFDGDDFTITFDGETFTVKAPAAVSKFASNFDDHKYDFLDENPPEEGVSAAAAEIKKNVAKKTAKKLSAGIKKPKKAKAKAKAK